MFVRTLEKSSATTPVLNDSGGAVATGDVLGYAGGVLAKAQEGVTSAQFVAYVGASAGATAVVVNSGVVDVNLATGATPAKGDIAFVDGTEAGTVTDALPAPGSSAQAVGRFAGTRDGNDRASVALNISIVAEG